MATRKVRLGITVGVPDPSKSISELKASNGEILRQAQIGVKYVPPGELVELDAEEADSLEARFPFREIKNGWTKVD